MSLYFWIQNIFSVRSVVSKPRSCYHTTVLRTEKRHCSCEICFVLHNSINMYKCLSISGPGSSVGIPTRYGLDGPGIESRWGEIFSIYLDRPWGPPSLLYNGYRVFPGGKERPGRDADPSPLRVPWSRMSRAIPLLPLWAILPVQSLSACTRVHFTLFYMSLDHMI
jgi:hypothetical protein